MESALESTFTDISNSLDSSSVFILPHHVNNASIVTVLPEPNGRLAYCQLSLVVVRAMSALSAALRTFCSTRVVKPTNNLPNFIKDLM